MKNLLLALFTLGFTVAAQAEDLREAVETQSRYYGVGWQSDGGHWSIELLVTTLGGQIAYPSLECAGEWTLINTRREMLEYVERIVEGADNCVALGSVFLEPLSAGRLLYTWRETVETIDARAVLLPLEGERLTYMELLKITLNTVDLDFMLPEFLE